MSFCGLTGDFFQADLLGKIIKFLAADFFQLFAGGFQFLINFDDFFGHRFVGFFGAADEGKIFACCDALVSVRIQTYAKYHSLALFLRI